MTVALFVHDHCFFKDEGGRVYSEGKITDDVFKRYFEAVDEVVVVSRMREAELADGLSEITNKKVCFQPVRGVAMALVFTRHGWGNAVLLEKVIERSDMAILRLPSFLGLWAAFRLRWRGVPYFVEVVGFPREAFAMSGLGTGRKLLAVLFELLTKNAVYRADGAIYVTREVLQKRLPNTGLTAFASNVELTVEPFMPSAARYALESGPVKFGIIGSFNNRYKGIDVAIQSIALLSKRGLNCRLRILGSGDREMILADAAGFGVADCVEFSGTLASGTEVYDWLDDLDIYLQPSRTEGLPRALVEAMSRGLPALGSDAGGIPELLPMESIHASGDAEQLAVQMMRLIADPALRLAEGQRNAAMAREYTPSVLGPRRQAFWAAAGDIALRDSTRPVRRLLLLGAYAPSLLNFRGPLIRHLVACGIEVHVGAPDIDAAVKARLISIGAKVHDTPVKRTGTSIFADLRYGNALTRLMARTRPDIVLSYTIKPNIWGAYAAARNGIPSISMVTGLGYAFTDSGAPSLRQRLVRSIARRLYRAATNRNKRVIFQNPDDRDDFLAAGCLADPGKIGITNGSGVDLVHFARAPLPDAPAFLMISRLLRNKGVREYAEASLRTLRKHPEARFLLVGPFDEGPDGISKKDLDRWIAEGLEYLGPADDVRPHLAVCRAYVLPSYREGTPRSVLEAMSVGRAIITTDAPGCRETVDDGVNGCLVPVRDVDALAEAMTRFLLEPDLAGQMGAESRRIAVEKYDVHKVNAVMLEVIGLS